VVAEPEEEMRPVELAQTQQLAMVLAEAGDTQQVGPEALDTYGLGTKFSMAYFALINELNVVENVIYVDNSFCLNDDGQEVEEIGISYCNTLLPGIWKQTSYNKTIRKNYAGIGYMYDSERDAFIQPCPYNSWVLDEDACTWICPTPRPSDGLWEWNEDLKNWIEIVDGQENQ
jgi:hypothetical protein